jgi:hypothetical protein
MVRDSVADRKGRGLWNRGEANAFSKFRREASADGMLEAA